MDALEISDGPALGLYWTLLRSGRQDLLAPLEEPREVGAQQVCYQLKLGVTWDLESSGCFLLHHFAAQASSSTAASFAA